MLTMRIRVLFPWILLASLGVLACDVSSLLVAAGGAKPTVTIQSPANGSVFQEGDEVTVQSTARDPGGIVRVELTVDGATVRTDAPPIPQGQVSFTLVQKWKATPGTHTLGVRAFNASGVGSDLALVSITVSAGSGVSPTAPVPSATASLVGGPGTAVTPLTPLETPTSGTPPPTNTRKPPTKTPAPTISAPPGVYAVAIRVDPIAPVRTDYPTFYVTFLNTTGNPQSYKWYVQLFETDSSKRSAFGETAKTTSTLPNGTSEFGSVNNWRPGGLSDCTRYTARVFWVNQDTKEIKEFLKPDQTGGPATIFQVCP